MRQAANLCNKLAEILGGKGKTENGVCMVTVNRKDIHASIANKSFHSLSHMFNFEPQDNAGNALITGEMVLLENEVPKVVNDFYNEGIIVTAIHSHWLYDNPKLMYIHMESVMNPTAFANKVSQFIKTL